MQHHFAEHLSPTHVSISLLQFLLEDAVFFFKVTEVYICKHDKGNKSNKGPYIKLETAKSLYN